MADDIAHLAAQRNLVVPKRYHPDTSVLKKLQAAPQAVSDPPRQFGYRLPCRNGLGQLLSIHWSVMNFRGKQAVQDRAD